MCPEKKQGTNKTGQRGMVLVRVIREHPSSAPAGLAAGDWERTSRNDTMILNKLA